VTLCSSRRDWPLIRRRAEQNVLGDEHGEQYVLNNHVVETDGATWVALARGNLDFAAAVHDGRVRASGERSNLSELLPLT